LTKLQNSNELLELIENRKETFVTKITLSGSYIYIIKYISMIELLKKLLGIRPKINFQAYIKQGATVVDVRTPAEFNQGHLSGAINLPLQTLASNLTHLKKDQMIITCCASGMRSNAAKRLLKIHGFLNVHNGGTWISLR
jgi:rhodanese-related sulfurtransferase